MGYDQFMSEMQLQMRYNNINIVLNYRLKSKVARVSLDEKLKSLFFAFTFRSS